ncbi:MAG: MerR family transcriptional regulator [Spirochaetia bacterium]
MLSIGEFSQAVRLSVKTLRYYQELGILIPAKIDKTTNYRYYDDSSYEKAKSIYALKDLGFTLQEIKKIFQECRSDEDLDVFIQAKLREIRGKVDNLRELEKKLSSFRPFSEPAVTGVRGVPEETVINLPALGVIPFKGKYSDIGNYFHRLYRKIGRYTKGKPYAFYYKMEYTESDMEMEAAVELTRKITAEGIDYRSILNRRAVKIIHEGPYGSQGAAYMKLFSYCRTVGRAPVPPIIEHFLKGPGRILRGNQNSYLTECIVLMEPARTHRDC